VAFSGTVAENYGTDQNKRLHDNIIYRSDSYVGNGDDAHICIEEIVLKDSP